MAWRKSPPELCDLFTESIPGEPRQMFGHPACFAQGKLFMGLHQESFLVRLGEADRGAVLALGGETFSPMAGRPMKESVILPSAVVADPAPRQRWVRRALEYTLAQPPRTGAAKGAAARGGQRRKSGKGAAR